MIWTGQVWSGLVINYQDGSGIIRTGQEFSRLVGNDQDLSGMIWTGQKSSGLVRNDKDWSKMIRTGQEWLELVRNDQDGSGRIGTGQDIITFYNLMHLCKYFVLVRINATLKISQSAICTAPCVLRQCTVIFARKYSLFFCACMGNAA